MDGMTDLRPEFLVCGLPDLLLPVLEDVVLVQPPRHPLLRTAEGRRRIRQEVILVTLPHGLEQILLPTCD
jgi:hypothetical protein